MLNQILLYGISVLGPINNYTMKTIREKCGIQGKLRFFTYKAGTAILLNVSKWHHNLVVSNTNSGLNLILKRLIGNTTYDLEIDEAKLGDDNTAVTDNDTDLGNAIVSDIAVASVEETTTSQITLEFFIADAEMPEDTYEEFGIFADTRLFARSIISPGHVKSVGEDIKVEYVINLSNT